jgi:SAM-dependent methyltransferase
LNFGDLKRFEPFCERWGNSRGGAIDRFYIDAFLTHELKKVRGRFLECGALRYHSLVPPKNVVSYDIVDRDPNVSGVTICCDIQDLASIAANSYDVVICTQVLQYVGNPRQAISELHRVLRPGGQLFLSVPFIEKDYATLEDKWRFTKKSVQSLLVPFRHSQVTTKGNLFSSVCYLLGLGQADVSAMELNQENKSFYQLVLAKARK